MSEKLYALLLRLYPAHFRKSWGEDALQLFRDRLRDEPGVAARLRLWMEVLADLAVSAVREHRRAPVAAPVPAEARLFQVLEMEPPRPSTFLFGGALALAGVAAFVILLSYAGERRPWHGQSSSASQTAGTPAVPRSSSTELSAAGEAQSPNSGGAEATRRAVPEAVLTLDAAERRRVLAAVIENLRQYEDDRQVARQMVAALLSSEHSGRFDRITSGRIFADAVNMQMARVSPGRAVVFYTNVPFTSINPSSTTHRIDDHFAISIPVGRTRGRYRLPEANSTVRPSPATLVMAPQL